MTPEAPIENPWDTPALDPSLERAPAQSALQPDSVPTPSKPSALEIFKQKTQLRIEELEAKNEYLFQRNITLVTKVAELEVLNRRLSEELSLLKRASHIARLMRWLGLG
jgi:hypothetical protein